MGKGKKKDKKKDKQKNGNKEIVIPESKEDLLKMKEDLKTYVDKKQKILFESKTLTSDGRQNIIARLRLVRKTLKRVNKKLKTAVSDGKTKDASPSAVVPAINKAVKTTKVADFKATFETPKVYLGNDMVEHILVALNEYTHREVMGLLIGQDVKEGTLISKCVILPQTGSGAHVEFEDDVIAQYMADNWSLFEDGYRVVGWWHTHPSFGTVQSGTDTQNNKDLIAPFVYGKKPCYMFSIITSKKFSRGGNMYQQYTHKAWEKRPFSVEDIQLSLYVFLTLGGFYAVDSVDTYHVLETVPYDIQELGEERYNEIKQEFESSFIDKKPVRKIDVKKVEKTSPSHPSASVPQARTVALSDADLCDPLEEGAELYMYRCDIVSNCRDFSPIEGDETGRLCDLGIECGIRSEEVGVDLERYAFY